MNIHGALAKFPVNFGTSEFAQPFRDRGRFKISARKLLIRLVSVPCLSGNSIKPFRAFPARKTTNQMRPQTFEDREPPLNNPLRTSQCSLGILSGSADNGPFRRFGVVFAESTKCTLQPRNPESLMDLRLLDNVSRLNSQM